MGRGVGGKIQSINLKLIVSLPFKQGFILQGREAQYPVWRARAREGVVDQGDLEAGFLLFLFLFLFRWLLLLLLLL